MSALPVLALTWFGHRRTENLCARLGWTYLVLETRSTGLVRYLRLAARTVKELLTRRPKVLVVQNPSLILAVFCVLLRPFLRFKLVVDAHNEAVQPYLSQSSIIHFLARQCLRYADMTIVTNTALAAEVTAAGGTPFVLPDPIPTPPSALLPTPAHKGVEIVMISTFARDEPIEEVMRAAASLPPEFRLKVTGRLKKLAPELRALAPPNMHFTDFLPEDDYWALLRSCDIILDLTLMPDCLVCGAYEAVSLRKPMILTEGAAARDWFGDAAVYADNNSPAIASALIKIASDPAHFIDLSRETARHIETRWTTQADELGKQLQVFSNRNLAADAHA